MLSVSLLAGDDTWPLFHYSPRHFLLVLFLSPSSTSSSHSPLPSPIFYLLGSSWVFSSSPPLLLILLFLFHLLHLYSFVFVPLFLLSLHFHFIILFNLVLMFLSSPPSALLGQPVD